MHIMAMRMPCAREEINAHRAICFHSLPAFLSSVRFLGIAIGKTECEAYFQKMANHVVSQD